MSKYFELLRSHHPKKNTPHEVEVVPTDSEAVSSTPSSMLITQDAEKSDVLLEEKSVPKINASTETLEPQDLLVAEHEAESSESPLGSSSKHEFNVSTWLQNIQLITLHIFQNAQQQKPTTITPLHNYLHIFMVQLEKNGTILNALDLEANHYIQLNPADGELNDLVQKSIALMLYMMRTGLYVQPENTDNKSLHSELQEDIVAAMLHHIGMTSVPSDTRNKRTKLTREEKDLIKLAPAYGAAYLKTCNIENDNIMLAVAQGTQLTESEDTKSNEKIWAVQMIGLLSMFESLTHGRDYRAALIPREAICEIVSLHKNEFNFTLLKTLIESITLYPVGIFVQLNTGDMGQVVATNKQYPLRPTVVLSMDKHGTTLTKRQVNLEEQPNLTIQESMFTIPERG